MLELLNPLGEAQVLIFVVFYQHCQVLVISLEVLLFHRADVLSLILSQLLEGGPDSRVALWDDHGWGGRGLDCLGIRVVGRNTTPERAGDVLGGDDSGLPFLPRCEALGGAGPRGHLRANGNIVGAGLG